MKALVDPLLLALVLQAGGLWLLAHRARPWARLAWVLLALDAALAFVSTPVAARWLEHGLALGSDDSGRAAPRFIFVLGGGYLVGATPDEDVLVLDSQRRVLHAVAMWRRFPDAKLVFSGAAPEQGRERPADRLARLMADLAARRGVPASAMLLEPRSSNTAEHPAEALKLPGVTPSTPIALVTNDWHMRRAKAEFCRYFRTVRAMPLPALEGTHTWRDWIPEAGGLEDSTTYLRECVGLAWYALLGTLRDTRQVASAGRAGC